MATKPETDIPPSPSNNESDGEAQDPVDFPEEDEDVEEGEEEEEEENNQVDNQIDNQLNVNPKTSPKEVKTPKNNNVSDLLKKLQSSGALIKKPKKEHKCYTCEEDFLNWEELEQHLIQHVSLPSVVVDKLPSDDEDFPPSGDENWSEEEEDAPVPPKAAPKTTPQKIDISQILKKTGISLKKTGETVNKDSNSALNKLSGLGFTIKKNTVSIKKEPEPEKTGDDVMKKLGQLGGIKLKLKSDGNNTNSFKVVNGLKDFKASDDEDEGSGNEESKEDQEDEEELEKSGDQEGSAGEQDSADDDNANDNGKTPKVEEADSDDSDKSPINKKISAALKNLKAKNVQSIKQEPVKVAPKSKAKSPAKDTAPPTKPVGRPAVKQTPKRGANHPVANKEISQEFIETTPQNKAPNSTNSAIDRRQSRESTATANMENVVVKEEVDTGESTASNIPLFSGQIKSERTSPPLETVSTPIISRIKSEPDAQYSMPVSSQSHVAAAPPQSATTTPLLPVTKQEDTSMTVIEINGDSGDDDDDCCVVSATPAPDIKPVIPKTEPVAPAYPPPAYPSSTPTTLPSYNSSGMLTSRLAPSTEKQHNFNWNAPDSKPPIDMLEKSADDIFESLLSSGTKKENLSLSDASEYISLDTLGPQQTCEVCNTRFTDMALLEEHRRMTGHSKSLVAPSVSSTLMPYNPSSTSILSSLLPVKQLAEQVGKLSTIGGTGPGFTHQQNVMINIQAYPGGGGMVPPQSPYGNYPPGQNMHPGYAGANNMYGAGQPMPGQYPGQHYMGQQTVSGGYGQFPTPMSKAGYPSTPNSFSTTSTPYSTTSPLQSMQQAYGQSNPVMMNTQAQMGQMGPPGSSPQYAPASSPGGSMKPPSSSGVRIQNVQTFPPGQMVMPGQTVVPGPEMAGQGLGSIGGTQMPSPSQIRMAAGATVTGTRPRMPGAGGVRGAKPSIRPGIQVHGQVRGQKPGARMPLKRPGAMAGGPGQKRRPDMLLPGKHDNEDCQVMAMQKQRDGLPMIQSVQGAKDKLNLGSQISITKKTVNKEASAMAHVLASRGISVKQKQKSRSPTPERPIPHIPNLGAGMSIKHTSKSSNFSIPEAKVGGGMLACKICKKMFMNQNSLQVHMSAAHPQSKIPMFKCDECPASYPKSLQLQHHKRVFHNVTGPNRELGLPVVDLSQEDNLKRLSSLGIYSFIPLANREQANGCFGIPVISVHNMQNGMTGALQALGADGLLSLGPLKPLPNT